MPDIVDAQAARVVIVTDNAVEALDLCDYFESRKTGPVLVVSRAESARQILLAPSVAPGLVILGLSMNDPVARMCFETIRQRDLPVILIDGHTVEAGAEGIPVLSRPFDTSGLQRAVDGFPDLCQPPSRVSGQA